jgi:putative peptidoglycan lipid II flippase
MTALVALGMVFAGPIIDLIEPGFGAEQVDRAARLTRIVLPAQIFFVVGSLFMAVQYAKERFVIPTFAPIIYNLFIIAGGILWARNNAEPDGFAWGVLAGAIVGNFGLQWIGAYQAGLRIQWRAPIIAPALKEYLLLAIPLMLGQSLVVLDEQLTRSLGSLADADGSISWLQFGRRTMLVPVGIIAQAAGVAAYPYLARLAAEGKIRAMAATLANALRPVIVLSLGAAALLAALALPVIRVLYERGNWNATDTAATAGALLFFSLAIPLWGAQQLYARAFYARRQMWTPVIVGTLATIAAIPLYWGLLEAFDVSGLALASTLALAVYTVVLAVLWHRSTGWEYLGRILTSTRRALPIAVLGGLAAWVVSELVLTMSSSALGALIAAIAGTATFGATVLLAVAAVEWISGLGAHEHGAEGAEDELDKALAAHEAE